MKRFQLTVEFLENDLFDDNLIQKEKFGVALGFRYAIGLSKPNMNMVIIFWDRFLFPEMEEIGS